MSSLAAEDASLTALEARATLAEQRLSILEALAAAGALGLPPPPLLFPPNAHTHAPRLPKFPSTHLLHITMPVQSPHTNSYLLNSDAISNS